MKISTFISMFNVNFLFLSNYGVNKATMVMSERVDLVDDDDVVIGTGLRSDCHGDPSLIHRAVHVLVFNDQGKLLLQKRSADKLIQPGKWDSSVGGHLDLGEDYRHAAAREMYEEIGVQNVPLTELYRSKIRNQIESENIVTYLALWNGAIDFSVEEIDEVCFWTDQEIEAALGSGCFTPNFEEEWQMFKNWRKRYLAERGERAFCAGDSFPDLFKTLREDI